jgi:hypothetical protein
LSDEPGAQEWRIVTGAGVVRVYRPAGYRPRDAALVVYVHGLYTDADRAWIAHRLPEQFDASARNALYVVAGARTAAPDPLPFPELAPLLALVAGETGLAPAGPLVAAGHSGAYKEIGGWLGHPRLRTVLLLDGLYGLEAELRAWVAAPGHRLALVSKDTAPAAARFVRGLSYAVTRPRCPDELGQLSPRERAAKVLSMGTDADHFGIVTDGRILPLLLRWAALPARW